METIYILLLRTQISPIVIHRLQSHLIQDLKGIRLVANLNNLSVIIILRPIILNVIITNHLHLNLLNALRQDHILTHDQPLEDHSHLTLVSIVSIEILNPEEVEAIMILNLVKDDHNSTTRHQIHQPTVMVTHHTTQNHSNIWNQRKEVVGIADHSKLEGLHIANQVSVEVITVVMEDIQLHKVRITTNRLAVVVLVIRSLLDTHHLLVVALRNLVIIQSVVVHIRVIEALTTIEITS